MFSVKIKEVKIRAWVMRTIYIFLRSVCARLMTGIHFQRHTCLECKPKWALLAYGTLYTVQSRVLPSISQASPSPPHQPVVVWCQDVAVAHAINIFHEFCFCGRSNFGFHVHTKSVDANWFRAAVIVNYHADSAWDRERNTKTVITHPSLNKNLTRSRCLRTRSRNDVVGGEHKFKIYHCELWFGYGEEWKLC